MKVLLLNGSPKANGNTAAALAEMVKIFGEEGIEAEVIQVGHLGIRGCIACGSCHKTGKCVFDDVVNEIADKFREADGLVAAAQCTMPPPMPPSPPCWTGSSSVPISTSA